MVRHLFPAVSDCCFFLCLPLSSSQTYEEEIVDDYITGVEQVGAEPTTGAETDYKGPVGGEEDYKGPVGAEEDVKGPVGAEEDVKGPVDGDAYGFQEYDMKEYDNKGLDDYGSYGPDDVKPTEAAYDDDFGPGIPAQTDIRESDVRPPDSLAEK